MPTWSQSLKKCSKVDLRPLLFATGTFLALAQLAWSATTPPTDAKLEPVIRGEIQLRQGLSFSNLLQRLEKQYGSRAFGPLLEIARDHANQDADRYVAMMAAAKIGGRETAPLIIPFLRDRSWMMRSGALKTLTGFRSIEAGPAVMKLLDDSALVVRTEAVEAVRKLRPAGAAKALALAAVNPENFHGGKALWVPQRALKAISELGDRETLPKLRPLLYRQVDAGTLKLAMDTMDKLAGFTPRTALPTAQRLRDWRAKL